MKPAYPDEFDSPGLKFSTLNIAQLNTQAPLLRFVVDFFYNKSTTNQNTWSLNLRHWWRRDTEYKHASAGALPQSCWCLAASSVGFDFESLFFGSYTLVFLYLFISVITFIVRFLLAEVEANRDAWCGLGAQSCRAADSWVASDCWAVPVTDGRTDGRTLTLLRSLTGSGQLAMSPKFEQCQRQTREKGDRGRERERERGARGV